MGIKKYREAAGMNQKDLADKLNVNQTAVSMWETGKVTPRYDKLAKMAQMFGCSIEDLMKKEE